MRRCACLVAATLLCAVGVVYLPTARHGFVGFDDPLYVSENPRVLEGLSVTGLSWALTTFHAANWHPLTWLSLMTDVSLFGPSPGAIHLESAVLHSAAAVAIFFALAALTGATGRSALAAFIFAVHPLHVESVAWAAERKDVLSGLLFGVTLLLWARHLRRPGVGSYCATLAAHAAGLLAKPSGVTLPLVLLVLDGWPLGRLRSGGNRGVVTRCMLEKIPFVLLSLVSALLTLRAQASGQALDTLSNTPLPFRLANAVVALATYLVKAFAPRGLAFYYPLPAGGWPLTDVVAATAALLLLGLAGFVARRRQPALGAGLLIFVIMLLPVLGLVRVGSQAMADRYTYLPLTWLSVAFIWPLTDAAARRSLTRVLLPGLAVALVALLGTAARLQAGYWRDSEILYRRALAVTGPNPLVEYNLGTVLSGSGRDAEAIAHYRRAASLEPGNVDAHFNLGSALMTLGRAEEALEHYRRATELSPRDAQAWFYRGEAEGQLGRWREAERSLRESLARGTAGVEALYRLALSIQNQGRREEAGRLLARGLTMDPQHRGVRLALERLREAPARP